MILAGPQEQEEAQRAFEARRPDDAYVILELGRNGLVIARWCRALLIELEQVRGASAPTVPDGALLLRLSKERRRRVIDFGFLLKGHSPFREAQPRLFLQAFTKDSLLADKQAIRFVKALADEEIVMAASAMLWAVPSWSRRTAGESRRLRLTACDFMDIALALGLDRKTEPESTRRERWAKRKSAIVSTAKLLRGVSIDLQR